MGYQLIFGFNFLRLMRVDTIKRIGKVYFLRMDQQLLNEIQLEQSMNYDDVKMVLSGQLKNRQNGRTEPYIVASMKNFTKCFKGREECIYEFMSRLIKIYRKNKWNSLLDKVCLYTNRSPNQTRIYLYAKPQLLNTPKRMNLQVQLT